MLKMLFVVAMYTVCSLNDKYAVSKAKLNGPQLTFLMAAGTVPFLALLLPFFDRTFTLSPFTFIFILLIAACKFFEFSMGAKILIEMSAFELKAWLGITLFISYFTDIIMYGQGVSVLKILCIIITAVGLAMIAKSGRKKVNYPKIIIPLIIYIGVKFGYGVIMKAAEKYISSTLTLFFALIILAVVLIPSAKPMSIAAGSPEGLRGVITVVFCKLPNALGLLGENAVAAQSLTNYSFIQPMILIVIFILDLFRKSARPTGLNLAGSILCVLGVLGFQAAGLR
ncbi:MAG: hypothetical protein NC395_04245 [Prevotella sp.]|nr:hypothetical protein [Prevotella sp.]